MELIKVIGDKNEPLKRIEGFDGYKKLYLKDESSPLLNETCTFKDKQPQALAKLLPSKYPGRKIVIAAMSTGNTAYSIAHFADRYNKQAGKTLARAVVFIPDTLEKRSYFGPDTEMRIVPTGKYIGLIERMATVIRLDFSAKNKFGRPKYLETLTLAKECAKRGLVEDLFIDVTEGLETAAVLDKAEIESFSDDDYVNKKKLGIRAYETVIKEAVELMKERDGVTPDIIVSQFGAGILYNEIVQYCKDNLIKAEIIPVAVGSAASAADKIYPSFWVDQSSDLESMGSANSKHVRYPATVHGIEDWELGRVLDLFSGKINAEISGLAGFAILYRLGAILGKDIRNKNVLVINTGNGIPNFAGQETWVKHEDGRKKLINVSEASEMLGVHPNTLRQWDARGIIHATRIGIRKDRRYQVEEIERLITAQVSHEKGYAFHRGMADFKRVFDSLSLELTPNDYYWTFAFDSEYANPEVRGVLKRFHESLAIKGVEDHVICRMSALEKISETFKGNSNIQIKATRSETPIGVVILKDRVLHLLWGEEPAIYEVLSAEAVRQYKNMFIQLWHRALTK